MKRPLHPLTSLEIWRRPLALAEVRVSCEMSGWRGWWRGSYEWVEEGHVSGWRGSREWVEESHVSGWRGSCEWVEEGHVSGWRGSCEWVGAG